MRRSEAGEPIYLWPHNWNLDEFSDHPYVIKKARGTRIWDTDGREYLDAMSGVFNVNIGYGDERVIEAMARQGKELSFCSPYAGNPVALALAKKLVEIGPPKVRRVFLGAGGSEATETALKLARHYHCARGNKSKYKVIARWISYHGASLGALSLSGRPSWRSPFQPLLLNFPLISPAYCYRCWFGKDPETCARDCAYDLERTIRLEGPETIAGFIVEPIVGGPGGAIVPPNDYFAIVKETCEKYDILLIFDEIITGFGRTGKMFACNHWNIEPDLTVFGKGATSGYAPIGGVMVSKKVVDEFTNTDETFVHALTYGGHPIACAAALECLRILEAEKLVEKSAQMGEYLMKRLGELSHHRIVGDVRGKGLMAGLELVKDKHTKAIFPRHQQAGRSVAAKADEMGVKLFGRREEMFDALGDLVAVSPPFVSTREEIEKISEAIEAGISDAESKFAD